MPVLKDVECSRCGHRAELMLDGGVTELVARCANPACRKMTRHRTVCNGGCSSRWRFNDWTYDTIRERFHVRGAVACDDKGNPLTDVNTGEDISARVNALNDATRDERRDRIHFTTEKKRGRAPIRIDLKRHANAGGKSAEQR